jgi:hypothetical protein
VALAHYYIYKPLRHNDYFDKLMTLEKSLDLFVTERRTAKFFLRHLRRSQHAGAKFPIHLNRNLKLLASC